MFLRKLLKINRKQLTWAFIDLIMIIIGVYCAFLIQQYAESEKTKKEKERVLSALKYELEAFRISLPGFADYMENYLTEIKDNPSTNFAGWRYSEPQYAYQIVEYAINLENSEIVDFTLYDNLQRLYVVIKQLEHAERSINRISEKYLPLVADLPSNHTVNLQRRADNVVNLNWFKTYAQDRSSSLKRVADSSTKSLKIINSRLSSEKRKEIETEIILSNANRASSADEAIRMVKEIFPQFTEAEVRELYKTGKAE